MKTIPVTKGDRRRGGGKRNKVDVSLPIDITPRLNTYAKQFHAMPGKILCLIRNSILFIYFKKSNFKQVTVSLCLRKTNIKSSVYSCFLSLSQVLNLFFQWGKIIFYSNSECASRINNKSKVRLQSLLHGQRPEKTVKDFNSECLTITFYFKMFLKCEAYYLQCFQSSQELI